MLAAVWGTSAAARTAASTGATTVATTAGLFVCRWEWVATNNERSAMGPATTNTPTIAYLWAVATAGYWAATGVAATVGAWGRA